MFWKTEESFCEELFFVGIDKPWSAPNLRAIWCKATLATRGHYLKTTIEWFKYIPEDGRAMQVYWKPLKTKYAVDLK